MKDFLMQYEQHNLRRKKMVNGNDSIEQFGAEHGEPEAPLHEILSRRAEELKNNMEAVQAAMGEVAKMTAAAGFSAIMVLDAGGGVHMVGCGTPINLMGLCAYGQGRLVIDMQTRDAAV
jgi:peroxiredoxin family protein